MKSPMTEEDGRLSNLVNSKVIKDIKHIDDDLCVKITFEDGEYLIVDTMRIDTECTRPYMPILSLYSSDGEPTYLWG